MAWPILPGTGGPSPCTKEAAQVVTARMGSGVPLPVPLPVAGQCCSGRVCLLSALLSASTALSCCLWRLLAPADQHSEPNGHWGGGPGRALRWGFSPRWPWLSCAGEPRAAQGTGEGPPPSACWQCPSPWPSPLVPGLQPRLLPLVTTLSRARLLGHLASRYTGSSSAHAVPAFFQSSGTSAFCSGLARPPDSSLRA